MDGGDGSSGDDGGLTQMGEGIVPTAPLWMWILLVFIAAVSFWCQATVTEERFVPALNVIATQYKIPDDIAGATLMAAGASSPELFSSFVALFITHSALGLGTIVGSEVFNQLIICAGAVFASRSGKLELDRAIVTREVGFYALGIILLWAALRDTRTVPNDSEKHIFIGFWDSVMVFSGYIAYVWVCANMEAVVRFCTSCCSRRQEPTGQFTRLKIGDGNAYGATSFKRTNIPVGGDLPFLTQKPLTNEPSSNFVKFYQTATGERAHNRPDLHNGSERDPDTGSKASSYQGSLIEQSLKRAIGAFSDGNTMRRFEFLLDTEKPSDSRGIYDIELNTFEDRLSCFMWQRSYFYNKARFATRGWHLRWFTLTDNRMISVPDRAQSERHTVKYPAFKTAEVDDQRLIVRLINPVEGKRDFYLMAPSKEILQAFLNKLELIIEAQSKEVLPRSDEAGTKEEEEIDSNFESGDDHVSLLAFPAGGSSFDILVFLVLLPLRFLMHFTVPDVRMLDQSGNPVGTLRQAFLAIFSCLVWLVIGSYAMVASLEHLAALMNIPDSVIGFTVSAAGTSLPNYVASKVAAQNGFGNMAVSNAFGSNTFNIMVGLGLPWVLYTSFGTKFQPYHALRDEGITESVIILALVLLVFIITVVPTNFTLYKWHGILFILMYIAYLTYAIGTVYW